jgi:hypothetical protein
MFLNKYNIPVTKYGWLKFWAISKKEKLFNYSIVRNTFRKPWFGKKKSLNSIFRIYI